MNVSGALMNPPLTQVSVWPTIGEPPSVGLPTGSGDSTARAPATTLTSSVAGVAMLPALSIASAVSSTVLPTAEAGGV